MGVVACGSGVGGGLDRYIGIVAARSSLVLLMVVGYGVKVSIIHLDTMHAYSGLAFATTAAADVVVAFLA